MTSIICHHSFTIQSAPFSFRQNESGWELRQRFGDGPRCGWRQNQAVRPVRPGVLRPRADRHLSCLNRSRAMPLDERLDPLEGLAFFVFGNGMIEGRPGYRFVNHDRKKITTVISKPGLHPTDDPEAVILEPSSMRRSHRQKERRLPGPHYRGHRQRIDGHSSAEQNSSGRSLSARSSSRQPGSTPRAGRRVLPCVFGAAAVLVLSMP